ncbi:MAG: glycine cleavage system protein GcvH [Desulfovibrio sp.]|jgi:glycine cleavage system H protein|nr:glycine cleavage system protein GcvH [Desulfovibrio sp.]MDD7476320.1 glycine cleavage system protein GcvH [Desulfovibrio sp.]MDY5486497.1 glycine cleavage system protein GcvH [Desulfovibrio sp.]MEE0405628.1 glycine cleavage system protein GcvH [Desulfovibrio sp.]HAK22705.1 glycine cleavage system protein GcvH [Desulfovibrio sp.]
MSDPKDLQYAKSHEWVRVEGDIATVGITDHAQKALGDITYAECPQVDDSVEAGKECGSIESVKAASDIFSPVSGTVTEVNGELEDAPETVNGDPYGAGWLFKVKLSAPVEGLLDADAYAAFCATEAE